ncbi:DNA-binding transcriptional ArsR family regulator [Streptosporangium album]|uniref:DNA-binding transcriptional ArsR family regulator n=1 Tax=Streptosporangium album TaxID=47479 RepID=A0A7W7WDW5_9ACTN|nr:helix-turn-helix domain-containing protein [Streptosporangium album]MBB4943561.1 DNA-binding transcriptional ArsR family regulator [Streptosporangium album]
MDTLELFAHPVRLRIVHAMSGGRILTTSQLCARMPEVTKATMYRHVGLLADAGILAVDGEQRVRGAVERRYRLLARSTSSARSCSRSRNRPRKHRESRSATGRSRRRRSRRTASARTRGSPDAQW